MDDDAAKQRIITHMNADHHDSVIRYLEHFHGLSSWTAYTGKISDVTLSELTFRCGDRTYRTAFDPPLKSFREARERLVAMDKDCVKALGRSDITIREFVQPYGPYLALVVTVTVTMVAFSRRQNFDQAGPLGRILPEAFRQFCTNIQPYLFWGMIAVHGSEMLFLTRPRLHRHNVNVRTLLYWQWMVDGFVEGFGTWTRFDKLVKRKQQEKAQQKH